MSNTFLRVLFASGLALSVALPAQAGLKHKVDVEARARGADHVVVAKVEHVQSRFERNTFGDDLIVSTVALRVSESLKNARAGDLVLFETEGGTVGDLRLDVSDLPALAVGERAVFFLRRDGGRLVPHLRGQGILKLDAADRLPGENLALADVRAKVVGHAR